MAEEHYWLMTSLWSYIRVAPMPRFEASVSKWKGCKWEVWKQKHGGLSECLLMTKKALCFHNVHYQGTSL